MLGEWTDKGNPVSGPGASTTFSSQSTAVIPYDSAGNKFVFMADRWTPADLANAPYVWLPMRFGEGGSLLGTLSDGRTFTRSVAVAPHHLQYVVNAGGAATRDWTRIADAGRAEGAMLNSSPEQPLGADPTTGKTWGFTGASGTVGDSSGDVYNTLRWAKNHESLVYTFTGLNPGKYSVYAGYYDPWPWANRAASVSVNGEIVDPQRLFTSDYKAGTYTGNVVGPDGTLAVQVSPTRSPDIQLSWLMVAADE